MANGTTAQIEIDAGSRKQMKRVYADSIVDHVRCLPEAGKVDVNGHYVLPSDWNNAEDDIYDEIV